MKRKKGNSNKLKHDGKHTAVDLFSGCGGLTLGLKKAGFKVLGAVDVDPLSIKTYRANHKDVTVWEADIRDLKPDEIKSKLGLRKGALDLLAGCPSCQGFSTMRTLNGAFIVDDPRNDLLLEFLRFVEALNPRTVMMENVPGLAEYRSFISMFPVRWPNPRMGSPGCAIFGNDWVSVCISGPSTVGRSQPDAPP